MNSFLERHEIDVGRALAVLFIAGGVSKVYDAITTLLISLLSPIWSFFVMIAGVIAVSAAFGVGGIVVGIALWHHSPVARSIVKALLWTYFALLVAVMVFGPFAEQFVQPFIDDIDFRGWSVTLRILIPLLQVPLVFVVLAALDCLSTRRRFRR